jgi:hypothetical protein
MCARSIKELVAVEGSAWPVVQQWIQTAHNPVEVLPANDMQRDEALVKTQISLSSSMGAVIYHTGGILVDHGWLRFLGSGHPKLPRSMPEWNRERSASEAGKSLGFWLIADDIVGGFFALNGGAFDGATGEVFYFAPDTLRWEPLDDMGYKDFLAWSLGPKLGQFYESLRWPGWQAEVGALSGDQALSFYPPLWTKEGKDVARCSRRPCPVDEIFSLNVVEFPRQLEFGPET